MGLGGAVELARGLLRTARDAMKGALEPVLNEPLAESSDGAEAGRVDGSDLVVGPGGAEVGLVGGEQHEGALYRLGLLATAGNEGFEVDALVGREADAVCLWHESRGW